MPVTGIGGFFFRARDPAALAAWYATHLGIGPQGDLPFWPTEAGPLLFQPFAADSDYFAADQRFMLNFRVAGLDAMIASLRGAGIAVETRAEWDSDGVGRFARLHDPEGHPIELWQPHG
ncbi:VOC family protein [Fertoebacter nigrum]|uniref:VOC family protein n=1 Tax=Fertoeibacter niger TaxID=2656921 RepID=A0A8X8KLG7_9RHOB|nr:VOC family protein [Fertoeibacter niger]NUB42815.1 VOC family protein [Fertoeibacter niger]